MHAYALLKFVFVYTHIHTINTPLYKRYFLTTASVDEMRFKSDEVFLQAAIKLNKMDFVGITEDMGNSVALLQCILGVPDVHVPKKNVGSYQPVRQKKRREMNIIIKSACCVCARVFFFF
jgi:hypothetical protein